MTTGGSNIGSLRELAALAAGAPAKAQAPACSWLWNPAIGALRIFFTTCARWTILGREHIPPTGPVIVAANHFSFLDPPLVGSSFTRSGHVMAKRELSAGKAGWLMDRLGVIPVTRGEADVDALGMALDCLRRGEVIGIFPEGTRGREATHALKPGHRGVALLAHLSGAPVIPIGVAGSDAVTRLGDLYRMPLRRPPITVNMGPTIQFQRYDKLPPSAVLTETTDAIMTAIARQLPPDYRGVYAERC